MAHELLKIEAKLLNTPHLIDPATFESIMNYLEKRNSGDYQAEASVVEDEMGRYAFNEDSGVAVMNIDGPLSYKPVTIMGFDCGGANYQTLKQDFSMLVDQGAKVIALNISSGGGEAYQCFATARYMRNIADEKGVKLISFVDGLAASAAYALACAGDEIIVAEGSEVGSIGVLVRLMNDSKALEKGGYERTFISAGKEKIPFAADGSFKPEFLADIQDKVDTLYTEFTGFVAERRNLSVESIISTEAKTFTPVKAMALGLIDKVTTVEGFYEYLADLSASQNIPERNTGNAHPLANLNVTEPNEETLNMEKAELEAKLAAAELAAQARATELADLASAQAALATEKAELKASLDKANEQLATMQGDIASKKVASRKSNLLQFLAEDAAEALNASLVDASDAVFETVVNTVKAQHELVKNSELMTELGGQGEQELTEQTTKSVLEVTRSKLNNK